MGYGTRKFKGSRIIPILSRINPIARIDTYFFKIHSNIVITVWRRHQLWSGSLPNSRLTRISRRLGREFFTLLLVKKKQHWNEYLVKTFCKHKACSIATSNGAGCVKEINESVPNGKWRNKYGILYWRYCSYSRYRGWPKGTLMWYYIQKIQ